MTEYNLNQILDIPDIPDGVIEAAQKGELVIFIGAGVSRLLGSPGWQGFALGYLNYLYNKDLINHREKEYLKSLSARKIISISKNKINENNLDLPDFRKILNIDIGHKKEKKHELYKNIYSCEAIYVTTNYDDYLDKMSKTITSESYLDFEEDTKRSKTRIFFRKEELLVSNLDNGNILHIHGSIKDKGNMIGSIVDYLSHYQEGSEIPVLLKDIFDKYTVLFIGYGLEEDEILEFIVKKAAIEKNEYRHYILKPMYKEEENVLSFEKSYYKDLGIKLVPYNISQNGYDQLINVMNDWSEKIKKESESQTFLDKIKLIDEVDKMPCHKKFKHKVKAVLELIERDKAYENYFFKIAENFKWFYPLKERGYFKPEKSPQPEETDKDGYYRIPEWNVLGYLERISLSKSHPKYSEYIDEILKIIMDISNYKNAQDEHIENYRTWWYFTKLLVNIPNEKISLEILELISIWMNSKFGNTLVSSEIIDNLLIKFLNENISEDNIIKAEKIIDQLTDLKKKDLGENKKYYLQEEEYELLADTNYFKEMLNNYSIVIAQNCTNDLIFNIRKKIKRLLDRNEVKISFKYNSKKYFLQYINDTDSNKKLILLDDENNQLTKINIEDYLKKDEFIKSAYNEIFYSMFENIKKEEYLKAQLDILYNNIYSYGTYTSFYEDKKYSTMDSLELLTSFLKNILTYKSKVDIEETKKIINEFLNDEYYYFKKMSIYIISKNIAEYKDVFWNILDNNLGELIISEIYFADELKHLFEKLKEIPENKKEKLEEIIEQGPNNLFLSEEEKDEQIKLWKQKRYKALSLNSYFNSKYQTLKNESNIDVELGPGIGAVKVEWNSNNSPLKQEEIMQLSNEELSNYILEFQPTNNWDTPTHEGFARNINAIAQKEPDKFIENLDPFLKLGYIYIYYLLSGITKAWEDKKLINCRELFNFIKNYLDLDGFWDDKFKVAGDQWNFSYKSVIGQIGLLIQVGTKKSDLAFEKKYINNASDILLLSIDKLEKENIYNDEPVTKSINTAFGKIIEALLILSLRASELNNNDKPVWQSDLKAKYVELLKKEIEEAYTMFGLYLKNIFFLDSHWTIEQIKNYEDLNDELWNPFMSGFLYNSNISRELFDLMYNNYLRALKNSLDKNNHKNLIKHITFRYLLNGNKENDLFSRLLNGWNRIDINEIIVIFWTNEDQILNKNNPDLINRIIVFWRKLYNNYVNSTNFDDNGKSILSNSIKLMVFINELDGEKVDWIKLALPYLQFEYNEATFIKELSRLASKDNSVKNLGYISDLLIKSPILRYRSEKVISIVESFFETEDNELIKLGRKICDKYSKSGIMQFKDLYERYN